MDDDEVIAEGQRLHDEWVENFSGVHDVQRGEQVMPDFSSAVADIWGPALQDQFQALHWLPWYTPKKLNRRQKARRQVRWAVQRLRDTWETFRHGPDMTGW